MSDLLGAAAEAMGIPEPLAERSARARAEASGQSYEEVLAAWAGGEAVASAPPQDEPAPETETVDEEEAPEETPVDEPAPAPAGAPAPAPSAPAGAEAPAAAAVTRPPILDAPADRPLVTVAGGLGVVILMIFLGFVFPSLPEATNEVRSSRAPLSERGIEGRHVYLQAGCASCHTQAVRSVVADVGVGPVSLPDTNQIIGYRRIGPDLSDVGNRLTAEQLEAVVTGPTHPPTVLSEEALGALITYLGESAPASPSAGIGGQS